MRFIHVSDINIGANPDSDRSWGKESASGFKDAFKRVVDKAKEIDCDLLIISGSLFCHQPVTRELAEVNLLLSTIPATEVVIIAGAGDRIRKNSSVLNFKWNKNVHYVMKEGFEKIKLPGIHTTVFASSVFEENAAAVKEHENEDHRANTDSINGRGGRASTEAEKKLRLLRLLSKMKEEAAGDCEYINLLAFYNCFASDKAFEEEIKNELRGAEFSYIALGGSNEPRELIAEKCAYAGLLTPLGMGTPGEHGIFTGDISVAGKRRLSFDFVRIAELSYIPLQIGINEGVGAKELSDIVIKEIEKRGRDNIYKLRLTGKRRPDTEIDLEHLKKRYRIEEISDETEPQYDFSELFAKHPQDMIGFYISSVIKSEEEPSSLEKKAMYYGINALLKTEKKEEK